jgi:mono/diheme cytochrome c family protein
MRARDAAAIEQVLTWAADDARPRWQRIALLEGVRPAGAAAGPGGPGGFAGRGGGRGGGSSIELASVPQGLLALARSSDEELNSRASGAAEMVSWPGKPRPTGPPADILNPEEERLFASGEQQYAALCASCHQANGEGLPGVAKSLVGSSWALAPASQVTRIVLHGKEGEMLMPPVGGTMTDEQVAAVLTYIRRSWGNEASPISVAQVAEARGESGARRQAWTEAELEEIRR